MDTWGQMEKAVELGLVKSIGVSNFNQAQIQSILDVCKIKVMVPFCCPFNGTPIFEIKPAVNQVECHPYNNQGEMMKFLESNGMKLNLSF